MAHSAGDPARRTTGSVLVIGSANVDVAVTTARLPRPGETVRGDRALVSLGGKGANQAVAAALSGAASALAARIGDDAFASIVRDGLARRGVDTTDVAAIAGATTGLAAIYVDAGAQNCIVVVPGANDLLTPEAVDRLAPRIEAAGVVVLQCEIPQASVARAVEIAAAAGRPVVMNPAPVQGFDLDAVAGRISWLVPNETEAAELLGRPVATPADAADGARALVARGVANAVVTLGAQGCVAASRAGVRHYPAPPVDALDTTGAGDAFVGCLAAALASGRAPEDAIGRALLYAALSTTRYGAQASYPDRATFEQALAARVAPSRP
jgi:ribokinase